MGTSLTSATGWMARFVLSAAVLCCNEWRMIGPADWAQPAAMKPAATDHVVTRSDRGGDGGFHATLTVGRGKRQVTVQLDFGRAGERSEDESL